MHINKLIPSSDFCSNHNIEISFITSLQQSGLIDLITIQETIYIETKQLLQLEKFVRFYYELGINLEGIETITHLLNRINEMQEEIILLKNKLRLYEADEM